MISFASVLKRLAADKRFTALSVLTLGGGIGLAVAIFALVYGVLLAPLPYPQPERLVDVSHAAPGLDLDDMDTSVPLYLRYRERISSFEESALVRDGRVSLTGLDTPDRVRQGTVTASLFRLAGVSPLLGRPFSEEDEKKGAPRVVLVSERFWRGRLGSDPRVLEREIEIDGSRRQVVGVLPRSFALPFEDIDVWLPFEFDPEVQRLGQFSYRSLARLKEGATIESALNELRAITSNLVAEFPEDRAAPVLARSEFMPLVSPLLDQMVGDIRSSFLVLSGAVGFVLLMACVNVANVFLVRAEGRRRELALRSALGASRRQILAEFFAEGLALALVSGVFALALARVAISALLRHVPEGVPRLSQVSVDGSAVAFALLLSIAAAILVALLPTLPYSRPDVVAALNEGGRGTSAGRKRVTTRRALVALQMALGLVLLIGAGLMVRSFSELSSVSPGFRPEGALTLRVSLPAASYDGERISAFVEEVSTRLRALPGVQSVGTVDTLPLTGSATGSGHSIEDFPLGENDLPPVFITSFADSGYQEALGFPLLEGRFLEAADHREQRRVVVVNETIARRYWPDSSKGGALGRRISPGRAEDQGWYEIVGVVGDIRHESIQSEPIAMVFYPIRGPDGQIVIGTNLSLVIRGGASPESLAEPARKAVWSIDPNVPITHLLTLEELVRDARAPMAFSMSLLLVASALAVLLGAVGTYGVVSYVASQRTQEIGVRMALGALRSQVRSMILRDGLTTAIPGLLIGLLGALALTRTMSSLLYSVSALDPWSFVLAPILLLAVAVVSSLLPAERVAKVNPLTALRRV
jgi:predicted permease